MSRDGTNPVAAIDAATAALEGDDEDGTSLLGTLIDNRYKLESLLGRGGMGLVYRASHVGLRRLVAVKVLHPSLIASSDVRNRFEREGYAVGRIKHPNCVEVYDRGKLSDGSLYLAMELLEGRPLSEVLEKEGQLAPGRALHILAHILRGLSHVHEAGLIHRDIKPENIFLIRQGSDVDFAKILDFGIAKPMEKTSLDDGVKLTQAGMAFGTPIYMAPEQALGNPLDGRADLYAAAVLGYEMLTGQPPFYSDDKLEVMSMHTAKPVPLMRTRLVKRGKAVPSSIERLIVKGLTKKPSDRYANADVFLAAVEHALRTPDGGVTDLEVDRVDTTGSQPLVAPDGSVALGESIAESIRDTGARPTTPPPELADPRIGPPPRVPPGPSRPPNLGAPAFGASNPGIGMLGGPAPAPFGSNAGISHGVAGAVSTFAGSAAGIPASSGVGIGLPYTGPQGEPIFGLTPEQRLASATAARLPQAMSALSPNASIANVLEPEPARARRSKKWVLYAGGAVAAIAIGIVIAVVTHSRRSATTEQSIADQALEVLGTGAPERALKLLQAHPDDIANDARAQLVLGHVQAARNDVKDAVAAYSHALDLDPALETDVRMRRSLAALANSKDLDAAIAAMGLWMRTGDEAARPALAAAATNVDLKRRHAFRPLVEQREMTGTVDWVVAYGYDLEQEQTCPLRKAAVARLRALDDSRAVPALQRALVRKGKTGSRQGPNACLEDDAKQAILYLTPLPAKPTPPP